jgi:hypothetical protein
MCRSTRATCGASTSPAARRPADRKDRVRRCPGAAGRSRPTASGDLDQRPSARSSSSWSASSSRTARPPLLAAGEPNVGHRRLRRHPRSQAPGGGRQRGRARDAAAARSAGGASCRSKRRDPGRRDRRPALAPGRRQLAFTLSSARSPADAYVLDVQARRSIERWTESEVGGLDPDSFSEPTLIKWKSFDEREIPGSTTSRRRASPASGRWWW